MSGTIFLGATEIAVDETAGTIQVEIRRTGSLIGDVTVTYGVAADTATAGLDYQGAGGTIVMADGVSSVRVPITILDDAFGEATEVLSLTLISAGTASLAAPRTTRIAILDNETPAPPPPVEPPLIANFDVTLEPLVGGLVQPIKLAFTDALPGKLFIAEKAGIIRLADIATGESQVFLDLTLQVNGAGDRGLVGMTLHPDFVSNPYVYAFYVVDPTEVQGLTGNAGIDGGGNRFAHLVRYTADAATGYTTVVPNSAVLLLGGGGQVLDDIHGGGVLDFTDPALSALLPSDRWTGQGGTPSPVIGGFKQDYLKGDSLSHSGGGMVFGPDGALYVAIGDGTSYNYADPRSVDVQALDSLSGKILRIDPLTGAGLPDNPFVTPGLDLDDNRAKVFQLGLRNPFSLAADSEGRLVIGDVGWFSFEEINAGGPGANFGWPFFEGTDHQTPGYRDMAQAMAFYAAVTAGTLPITMPLNAFGHDAAEPGFRLQALVGGGTVYNGSAYPAIFQNDFFFSDLYSGQIFSIDVNNRAETQFVTALEGRLGPIQMVQGSDGLIYYADIVTGEIGRMHIVPPAPPPPQEFLALGNATIAPDGIWRLTQAAPDQNGGVASTTRVDFGFDARLAFDLNFGNQDAAGAEGIALVLHNAAAGARALGAGGNGLGAAGIERSLVLRIDTWQSGPDEPRNDHLRLVAPGVSLPPVDLGNVEDGLWHRLEVGWDAATQRLTVRFDGRDALVLDADLAQEIFGGNFAHVTLTGATGGFGLAHQARLVAADVRYENVAQAQAPVLFGGASRDVSLAENSAGIFLLPVVSDAEGDAITWRIADGADRGLFTMDSLSGALNFRAGPDFEAATDANRDNRYELVIEARDSGGLTARQALSVTVTDIVVEPIRGTSGADVLTGRAVADLMTGFAGNDLLRGGAGNDTFMASFGDGNDTYQGGTGSGDLYSLEDTEADAVVMLGSGRASSAETGTDLLRGIENVIGGGGNDSMVGNAASNVLRGLGGADTLSGGDGDDVLEGGNGHDVLYGGAGADLMTGGAGNDRYWVDDEDDEVIEAARGGTDLVTASIDFVLPANVERLTLNGNAIFGGGNVSANLITGNALSNRLEGGEGADTLIGGGGADTLQGGLGVDRLDGGDEADVFFWASAAEGGDRVIDYRGAEDSVAISAAGFGTGLVAGMNLMTSGRYEANALGVAMLGDVGVFVFETDTMLLRWDADGVGAALGVVIADFTGATDWSGSEIIVIA